MAGDIVGGQRLLNPQQVKRFEQLERAQRLQQQINVVVEQLVARGVFQSAKYLAAKETVDTGPTREPFVALTAAQKGELDDLYLRLRRYIADAGQ